MYPKNVCSMCSKIQINDQKVLLYLFLFSFRRWKCSLNLHSANSIMPRYRSKWYHKKGHKIIVLNKFTRSFLLFRGRNVFAKRTHKKTKEICRIFGWTSVRCSMIFLSRFYYYLYYLDMHRWSIVNSSFWKNKKICFFLFKIDCVCVISILVRKKN